MNETTNTQSSLIRDFSPRQNDIRALIGISAVGTAAIGLSWPITEWVLAGAALVVLIYTIVSYIWVKKTSSDRQTRLFDIFMSLDAAVIGAILTLSGFNLLPTVLLITTVQFNSLFNGGIRKWALDSIALIVGILLSYFFTQPQWSFSDELEISTISVVGIFSYFCAYALYAHNRMRKLDMLNKKLTNEQVLFKLRTYKLSRYLTPTVWRAVNEGREKSLKTERKRITVFFSDIMGFTSLSEELEAETLTDLLNSYLTEMSKIVAKHKGTIDKFMGDAIMVIFGDTQSQGLKADCLRCLSMAIEMRKKMKELQHTWYNQGIKKPLQIRMGINSGFCTVGSFGTSHYMDYTVLGTHVNLASRLETAADPGEILISHETWSLIKDSIMCRDKGEISVKGFSHPIKVYQVVDFRKDLGKHQSYFEDNSEGFSMHLDLEKIRNYDKDRVIETLEKAASKLKEKNIY